MKEINKIVIIGSGNVAWHLSHALQKAGMPLNQVYSRNEAHARELADSLNVSYISDIQQIEDASVYLFAVSDSAIESILISRQWNNAILLHTAGSVNINVFAPFSENYGVLYPLQSFTKDRELDITAIPFFIEANNAETKKLLNELAIKLSPKIYEIDSEARARIHLAAVFASNYTNYMITVASQLIEKESIAKEVFNPLLEETFKKAMQMGSLKAQTGPARRNNVAVLRKHEQMLSANPDWQKIYTFMAENIVKFYKQRNGKF